MSQASWDIEQIVQEVLAALQGQGPTGPSAKPAQSAGAPPVGCAQPTASAVSSGAAADGPAGSSSPAAPRQEQPQVAEDGQLRIASRLVTMADLRACGATENLAGVRRVIVRPDALVTPLVRDELQRRNIPLVPDLSLNGKAEADSTYQAASAVEGQPASVGQPADGKPSATSVGGAFGPAGGAGAKWNLLLVIHGKAYEPAGLVRRLVGEGAPVEVRRMDCIVRATDELAEAVRSGHCLGVLLTRYAAIGVCAANRHSGVRAVCGVEAGQAASDTASLGANLLVINPRQTPPYQLHKMIQEFYQTGVRPCPEGLKSRLG